MMTPRSLLILLCVLLADAPTARAADDLGHLFTTQLQREVLNQLRNHQYPAKTPDATIQGYVKRSDGISTLWLEHKPLPQHAEKTPGNAHKQ